MFPQNNTTSGSDKPQTVAIRYTMEVRIHFTHGLPTTNQVDLFIGRLQNPSWFNCFIAKSLFLLTMDIMCWAVGICFSYSFVKRGICSPKQVMAVWKSNSLHAWKSQSVPPTLGVTPVQGGCTQGAKKIQLKCPNSLCPRKEFPFYWCYSMLQV